MPPDAQLGERARFCLPPPLSAQRGRAARACRPRVVPPRQRPPPLRRSGWCGAHPPTFRPPAQGDVCQPPTVLDGQRRRDSIVVHHPIEPRHGIYLHMSTIVSGGTAEYPVGNTYSHIKWSRRSGQVKGQHINLRELANSEGTSLQVQRQWDTSGTASPAGGLIAKFPPCAAQRSQQFSVFPVGSHSQGNVTERGGATAARQTSPPGRTTRCLFRTVLCVVVTPGSPYPAIKTR